RDPARAALPDASAASVQRLLRRCLQKDPRRRLRDIGQARIELENPSSDAAAHVAPAQFTRRNALTALGGAIAGAAGIALIGPNRWHTALPRNFTRFAIAMPEGEFHQVSFNDRVAFSPDGTRIAFNTVRTQPAGVDRKSVV